MSSMYIKRIWSDINMIELEISANGLGIDIYSQSGCYVTESELIELKEKLLRFPVNKEDSVEWIIGSREENIGETYFKFRAFIIDKRGHVAIEVEIDNKLKEPYTLYSHFYIHTEVASINELGHNIDKLLIEDSVSVEAIAVRSSD